MPDRSKDRGLTKLVEGMHFRQPVFSYVSPAAGAGSLRQGARQPVPRFPAGWGRFQLLLCWNHWAHECATAGQPVLIPAVMLWLSAGYVVGRSRGGYLSWASNCPNRKLPWRSALSITNANSKWILFKLQVDWGPLSMAGAACLVSCVKQARPCRQGTMASLTLGYWNVCSLGPQTEAMPSSPRKITLINVELDRLRIHLASISETWWCSSANPGGVHQSKENITPYFGTVLRVVTSQSRESA